jgi:hypothetical protein
VFAVVLSSIRNNIFSSILVKTENSVNLCYSNHRCRLLKYFFKIMHPFFVVFFIKKSIMFTIQTYFPAVLNI